LNLIKPYFFILAMVHFLWYGIYQTIAGDKAVKRSNSSEAEKIVNIKTTVDFNMHNNN
jgi:hypothetical protein